MEKRNKKSTIFLCYAHEDEQKVSEIYHKLKEKGFNPWLDKEDLLPGQFWKEEIPEVIRASSFMIIFFSSISVSKRGYVQREFKLALDTLEEIPEDQIFVIPVRLDECQIPDRFSHIHYVDLFEEGGFEKVLEAIQQGMTQSGIKEKTSETADEELAETNKSEKQGILKLMNKIGMCIQKNIGKILIGIFIAVIAYLLTSGPEIEIKKYEKEAKVNLNNFRKDTIKVAIEHPLLGRFLKNYIKINEYRLNLYKFTGSKGTESNQYNYYFPIDTLVKDYPDIFKKNQKLIFKVYSESPLGIKSVKSFEVFWDTHPDTNLPPLHPFKDTVFVGDVKPNYIYKSHFFLIECENEKLYITLLKKQEKYRKNGTIYYSFSRRVDSIIYLGKYESENIICTSDTFILNDGFNLKEELNKTLNKLIKKGDN